MREIIAAPTPGLDLRHHYGHHQTPAIRAGGLIFCSGMVAVNPETGEREHGTVTSEARRIFENLKLLLESSGSSLDRLIQVHAMIYDRIEYDVLNRLKPGVIMCREKQDSTSAFLLEGIIADEENHVDYLETQLELMDKLGEQLYSAQCVSRPPQ